MSARPTRNRLAEIQAGTHALVDLDRYASNLKRMADLAGPGKRVLAVVKANAYGHGAIECARAAIEAGCSYLGVARIDEALQLRRSGVEAPILVIGPPNSAQIGLALDANVSLTVSTEESLSSVVANASARNEPAVVHIKVDTGLHRYGALPELAFRLARQVDTSPHTSLEGLYTHFSSADEEETEPTLQQIEVFQRTVELLGDEGIEPPLIHTANSAATIAKLFPGTNMVRAGIASYGLDPSDEVPVSAEFRQILTVKSVLTRRFTLPAGESVSYNRTYTADADEAAGAVPIGYADGIERHLSNRGWFIHVDSRCPIIGRVCMDQTVVRVPSTAREGDAVTVIGDGEDGSMTVAEVGEMCATNTYEPATRIAARVPRIYLRSERPASWAVPLLGESGTFEGNS